MIRKGKKGHYKVTLAALLCTAVSAEVAIAQHGVDVQRLSAREEHLDALETYSKLPKRQRTNEATIASARSAWALSLPDLAIERFEMILADRRVPESERARVLLSHAIIDFQEERYQLSLQYVREALKLLKEPSPLRGRLWLLSGENSYQLGQYGPASEAYTNAANEAEEEYQADIHYRLGLTGLRLGNKADAASNFERVPLGSERAPGSLRHLTQIALELGEYEKAELWLTTGRREFPENFIDSWVDYALVQVAIHQDDAEKVKSLLATAESKYPPSDEWLTLLHAAAEAYQWRRVQTKPEDLTWNLTPQ
jgi:tetratricopeptide (TPR) repeat protein